MATTKFQVLVLLVTCVVVSVGVSAAGGGPKAAPPRHHILGGWTPIKNTSDPNVQSVGHFAVTQHNMEAQTNLVYENVARGWTQVVAGVNYRLFVAAKGGAVSNLYEAVVWVKSWEHTWNLTSFKILPKA